MAKEPTPKKITDKKEVAPKRITRPSVKNEDDKPEEHRKENVVLEDEDYLRKYQYGREMPLGDKRTDPSPGGKAYEMKRILLSQPRVSILIPVDAGSDPSVPLSVTLNGYRLDLPRQTYLEVPKQVAEIVMQSQKQTVQALDQFRSNKRKDVEDALA